MNAHLTQETLWDAATTPPVGDDYAHLQLCPDCRASLDEIKFARGLLVEPAPPPVLPDASARRIGDVLKKAAEKQARASLWWGAWWPFNFNPTWVLAPLAAVLLAFVAWQLNPPQPIEPAPPQVAKNEQKLPEPPLPNVESPLPVEPPKPPVKKLTASVTLAKKASGTSGELKKATSLTEGNTVATQKGGSLWMKLPDGSRAGLTGASQVQLARLEEKAVTLDIEKGSLVVVARHDPSRELRVRAGELEVIDVGTRFLVSRDVKRTLVAVEEGEVEVEASGKRVPVRAGQAVEWRGGKLERQAWASTADEPKPRPSEVVNAQQAVEETPPIPSEGERATPPAPPGPAEVPSGPDAVGKKLEDAVPDEAVTREDEWSTPGNLKDAPLRPPPPPVPPPEPPVAPAPAAAVPGPTTEGGDDEADVSFLQKLEMKLKRAAGLFKPPSRLQRANDISRAADARSCDDALSWADGWLQEPVPKGESFNLRRSVLQSKLRCLTYQGRTGDAAAVQAELNKL